MRCVMSSSVPDFIREAPSNIYILLGRFLQG